MSEQSSLQKKAGKVIGLTGGIASGKSTAAEILLQLGCTVIDADKIGHETYLKGSDTYQQIIHFFGPEIVDKQGEIDRRKLGSIVFSDKNQLSKLCDIVWPEIKSLSQKRIVEMKAKYPEKTIILEAAVLIEARWEGIVDEVWVIYVDPDLAAKRLMSRNKLSLAEAQARLGSQISNDERLAKANASYENKGSIGMLRSALENMLSASSSEP